MPASEAMSASQKGWLPDISATAKSTPKKCALDSLKGQGRRPVSRSSRMSEVSWGTDDTDMSECICTICDCGKHACPVHKWQPTAFGGNSRYREDYPAHPLAARQKMASNRSITMIPADPDHFKSKYLEDFQAFNPDPAKSMKPKETPLTSAPFTGTTTNREVYTPKSGGPAKKWRPPTSPREPLPFDGTTTNKEQYKAHLDSKPRESMAPRQQALPNAPFEGQTAYKDDYPAHQIDGSHRRAAEHSPYDYGPARDLATEQRTAFTKKPIHICPVLTLQKKEPSSKTGHIHYTKKHTAPGVTFSATREF